MWWFWGGEQKKEITESPEKLKIPITALTPVIFKKIEEEQSASQEKHVELADPTLLTGQEIPDEQEFIMISKEEFEEAPSVFITQPEEAKPTILEEYFAPSPSFSQWTALCKKLAFRPKEKITKSPVHKSEFIKTLNLFFTTMKNSEFSKNDRWLEYNAPNESFFSAIEQERPFKPFVEKQEVKSDSVFFLRGDLHGDIHSLIASLEWLEKKGYLDDFVIQKPDFYIAFLGDYTDRGAYGLEVLYTILRLKIANPDKVFLVRGNHEDLKLNSKYGFKDELITKLGADSELIYKTSAVYDFMPTALFVGTGLDIKNFAQFCHGGLELSFNHQSILDDQRKHAYQWITSLDRKNTIKVLTKSAIDSDIKSKLVEVYNKTAHTVKNLNTLSSTTLGHMWSDFFFDDGAKIFDYTLHRGFIYGKRLTETLLNQTSLSKNKLRLIIRGHQHNKETIPTLLKHGGLYAHWSGIQWSIQEGRTIECNNALVWTFNVAPGTPYGTTFGYNTDIFALLHLSSWFNNWKLEPHRIVIKP
jgi:hypothetical protein